MTKIGTAENTMLRFDGVGKEFVLHTQDATRLPVIAGAAFVVERGECVVLGGPSGIGKSTLLRMAYGNYVCRDGAILLRQGDGWLNIAAAEARQILAMRRRSIGYVSQFLDVIPRVSTLDVVAAPLRRSGLDADLAQDRAAAMLGRLNIPPRLWPLSPVTFSGGEQQRVNIARGFIKDYPVLLLDEPTASLDAANRATVIDLINETRARGTAILGIFHDPETRAQAATRIIDVRSFQAAA